MQTIGAADEGYIQVFCIVATLSLILCQKNYTKKFALIVAQNRLPGLKVCQWKEKLGGCFGQ